MGAVANPGPLLELPLTACSDLTVFVRLRACHAITHSYFTWPWPV